MDLHITKGNLVSAILAGVIAGGTAMVALLTDAQAFSDVAPTAYAVVAVGMVVQIAKDLQSSNRPRAGEGDDQVE